MVFEQKKIQLETLGEYLREVREGLGISVLDVSRQTRIKLSFLQALESGDFKLLPPDVYVLGFLRQLAETYSVNSGELVDQYKKEKGIANQIQQRQSGGKAWPKKYLRRIVITPKFLSIAAGLLFVAVTLGYIIWQVASINKLPSLEIYQPQDRQVINDSYVVVKGKTDSGMSVQVNGQDVFVGSDGSFQIQLGLESGPKQVEVVAKNKFGKTAIKDISVVGQPSVAAPAGGVELRLVFSGDGTLDYNIDDGPDTTLDFHSGDSKVLTAQSKIVISTSDAGATAATLNGKALGVLGRKGEQLQNIPFFANNAGP